MFLKKENDQYFLSGGVSWIPLPEKLKTRKDVDEYLHLKGSKTELSYATDDQKPAMRYDVYWRNNVYPQALENESRTLVINVPPYAGKEKIIDTLRQRAKSMFNKEVVIVFTEEAPIPPEQVPED
jgi:hypothetical protein